MSVGTALVAIGSVAGLSFAVSWTLSRPVGENPSNLLEYHERAGSAGVNVATVSAIFAVFLVDNLWRLGASVLPRTGVNILDFIAGPLLAYFVTLYLATIAVNAGQHVNYRHIETGKFPSFRQAVAAVSLPFLFYPAGVVTIMYFVEVGSVVAASLVPLGLLGLWTALSPSFTRLKKNVRPLTDRERELVEDAFGMAGIDFDLHSIRVIETNPNLEVPRGDVRGMYGRRRLLVTDSLFEAFDEETFQTLVVQAAKVSGSLIHEYRTTITGTLLGTFVFVLLVVPISPLLLLVGLFLAWLVAAGVVQRKVYQVDEQTAEQVGPARLLDAYRTVAKHDEYRMAAYNRFLFMQPSIDRRIERLQGLVS